MTKQKDLTGFYRHLLKQTTGGDPEVKVKEEVAKVTEEDIKVKDEKDSHSER